jgi:putative aldouronate transport system substrate-binding protein
MKGENKSMYPGKRKWVLLLALTLTVSMAASACSGKKDGGQAASPQPGESGKPQDAPIAKEISISMFDRGLVPSSEGTYEDNRWTKWINENAPVKVKFVPVPRTKAQDQLNTLVASGEAPDLIWEYDRTFISKLASQGAIQPIDKYIEKYSTSYKKYLAEHPELKPYLTIDGKMYAVASERAYTGIANHGMWIRQDWLDKLNLKTPTTVDELLDVAKKFTENDPDGNGKADTVGIAFNYNGFPILESLFFSSYNQWYLEDGKMKFGRLLDRHQDAMDFEKKLFDAGLIDKEYITDTTFQREKQLFTTGKAGIYLAGWDVQEYNALKQNVPNAKLVPLEPVASKYGKNGLYQEAPPGVLVAFNSKITEEKAAAAVKYLDWMLDKGWMPLTNGTENVHYKMVNGIPQRLDANKFKNEVSYALEYGVVTQWNPKPEWFPTMAPPDPISQEYAIQKTESLNIAMKNKYRRDIPYAPDFPELNQLISTFDPIAKQIEAKVITGGSKMTAQQGIEELRKEWKRLGGDNVEKMAQDWYDKNKSNLK